MQPLILMLFEYMQKSASCEYMLCVAREYKLCVLAFDLCLFISFDVRSQRRSM